MDAGDRITSQTINGVTQTFSYDALDQIISDNGTSYSYDAAGNRTNTGYVTGDGNQLESDGSWTYTYDDAGQMVSKSQGSTVWTYSYDHNGQLISASKAVSGTTTDTVTYSYDAWGNRIARSQTGTTTSTERFVYDGWDTAKPTPRGTENFDVVIDLNSSNAVKARRL